MAHFCEIFTEITDKKFFIGSALKMQDHVTLRNFTFL